MTFAAGFEPPLAEVARICRVYQVRELSVFGSAARGELSSESDIDLLVEFEPGAELGLLKYSALMRELSSLLGRRVDLVAKSGIKPQALISQQLLSRDREGAQAPG